MVGKTNILTIIMTARYQVNQNKKNLNPRERIREISTVHYGNYLSVIERRYITYVRDTMLLTLVPRKHLSPIQKLLRRCSKRVILPEAYILNFDIINTTTIVLL